MQYHEAKLLASAAERNQWPDSTLPELIFAGRSNAGKSTLINGLVNRKNLAFAGKTPGKTRLLNFFTVDGRIVFTDAPGYGYATSDKASAVQFSRLIDPYFRERKQLKGMVIVLDARRKPNEDDIAMVEYARAAKIGILAAFTKTDKLSRSAMIQNRNAAADILGINRNAFVPCSSVSRQGYEELWEKINQLAQQDL